MVEYVFVCACGCGQISKSLGNDYRRLVHSKWYAKDCEPKECTKKEFHGGFLVEVEKQNSNGKTESF